MTNPVYLRDVAQSLDATADILPHADAVRNSVDFSSDLDDAITNISWALGNIANELTVSYSHDTKKPLPRNGAPHATAISGCAAPMGNAIKHLSTAVDRLSSHHHILRPATATPLQAPDDLLAPLERDISRARTAIRKAATQLRGNAALLETANTPFRSLSATTAPSAAPRPGHAR